MVLKQLEKDSNDIMAVIKKEKTDRERDTNQMKDRIDNERKEMQILIDKDRDNFNNKIKDEHDQRRIEQMELVQRVDNNEKCGSTDIKVSFLFLFSLLDNVPNTVVGCIIQKRMVQTQNNT